MRVIKTVSLDELAVELALTPQSLIEAADIALGLPRVIDLARSFCPVLTGALRDTIRVERQGMLSAKLVAGDANVRYAGYVHDGTSRMPPRPFLAQALALEQLNIGDEMLMRAAGVS